MCPLITRKRQRSESLPFVGQRLQADPTSALLIRELLLSALAAVCSGDQMIAYLILCVPVLVFFLKNYRKKPPQLDQLDLFNSKEGTAKKNTTKLMLMSLSKQLALLISCLQLYKA